MKKWVVLLLALALCVVPAAALDGETVPGWDGLWDQAAYLNWSSRVWSS